MPSNSSETPAGVVITAQAPLGETRNITEGVQVLYDMLIHSMDFGSGFLSIEDIRPIVELANFCGFKGTEEAQEYMDSQIRAESQRKCPHDGAWVEKSLVPHSPGVFNYMTRTCEQCGLSRVEYR